MKPEIRYVHWEKKIGRAACGADNPNQSLTWVVARVTCPKCQRRVRNKRKPSGSGFESGANQDVEQNQEAGKCQS